MIAPEAPIRPAGLSVEKYERILAAAMAEFSALGFERASMAEVAGGSGCSKALLFHYFATKANLFVHTYKVGMARLYEAMVGAAPQAGDDLFTAVERSAVAKARLARSQPHLSDFMVSAWYETATDVAAGIRKVNAPLLLAQDELLLGLAERTRLRPGVAPGIAVNLVQWTADGFARAALACEGVHSEDLEEQIQAYLEPLRRGLLSTDAAGPKDLT